MNPVHLKRLLEAVRAGDTSVESAIDSLRSMPFEDVGDALVDHHRALRQGVPEVIYGSGKTLDQIATIMSSLSDAGTNALVTRIDEAMGQALAQRFPRFDYHRAGRVGLLSVAPIPARKVAPVVVVTAGTSDLPVAHEARITLDAVGLANELISDAGVAGLHRILAARDKMLSASALIVIAGMEGALPSVVGGVVSAPVIAVPTSVGYGASLGGMTALLGMLSSCANGVVVVNIDSGFGAAMAAHRFAMAAERQQTVDGA